MLWQMDIKIKVSKAILAASFVIDEAAWKQQGLANREYKKNRGKASQESSAKFEAMMASTRSWAEIKLPRVTDIAKKLHDYSATVGHSMSEELTNCARSLEALHQFISVAKGS